MNQNENGLVNRMMNNGFVFGALVMLFVATMASVGMVTAADGELLVSIKESYPSLSPDFKKVAYISYKDLDSGYAKTELWIMNTDGSNLKKLDEWTAYGMGGLPKGWSPDGNKIIFWKFAVSGEGSRTFTNDSGLWIINSDGTGKKRISEGGGATIYSPIIWNSDGSKIISMSGWYGGVEYHEGEIFIMNLDGSMKLITNGALLDWMPDGKDIFYCKREKEVAINGGACNYSIWRIDIDSGITKKLTEITTQVIPAVSPDGGKIAFLCDGIWVANLDGSGLMQLTQEYGGMPFWSPNSERIAFISGEKGIQGGIWIMNSDGSEQKKVTSTIPTGGFLESQIYPILWSKEGCKIAYVMGDYKATDIYTINVGKSSPITPPAGETPTEKQPGIPGFEAVFAIGGLLAVAYILRRRK